MPAFTTLDIILAGLLLVGLLRGSARGLSGELAGLIGIAVAGFAGWHLYAPLGKYLDDTTRMSALQADTVAFLIIIVGALIVLWAVSMVLKHIMEFAFKGALERFGGALIGFTRYAVILAVILLVVSQFASDERRRQITQDSLIGRHTMERIIPFYEDLVQRYPDLPALPGSNDDGADDFDNL